MKQQSAALKVMSALAWLLRVQGDGKFSEEAKIICRGWSAASAEARRLEDHYFPHQAGDQEHSPDDEVLHK